MSRHLINFFLEIQINKNFSIRVFSHLRFLFKFWVFEYISHWLNSNHYESWEDEVPQDSQEITKINLYILYLKASQNFLFYLSNSFVKIAPSDPTLTSR